MARARIKLAQPAHLKTSFLNTESRFSCLVVSVTAAFSSTASLVSCHWQNASSVFPFAGTLPIPPPRQPAQSDQRADWLLQGKTIAAAPSCAGCVAGCSAIASRLVFSASPDAIFSCTALEYVKAPSRDRSMCPMCPSSATEILDSRSACTKTGQGWSGLAKNWQQAISRLDGISTRTRETIASRAECREAPGQMRAPP